MCKLKNEEVKNNNRNNPSNNIHNPNKLFGTACKWNYFHHVYPHKPLEKRFHESKTSP